MANQVKVGDEIDVWWHTGKSRDGWNIARVLEVLPYNGWFTEYYNCVLKLSAPRCRRGWLEMAYLDPGRPMLKRLQSGRNYSC